MIGATGALVAAALASLGIGPTGLSFEAIPAALRGVWSDDSDPVAQQSALILFDLRLPRTLLGMFVGAALAVSGAMMQGLFRNPLADPGIVGVSAGAGLFAVATIALSDGPLAFWAETLGIYALPVSAFLGGAVATLVLVIAAGRGGQMMVGTLLLAGIAMAALAGAATGAIAQASNDQELRDLTLWQFGSLTGSSWDKVAAIVPFAIVLIIFLPRTVRALNGLLIGEAEAFHLGVNVARAKFLIIGLTAVGVGASVAVAGLIGFVGIVVPHFVRLIAGPDNAVVIPASALCGATILLIADVIARIVVQPAEFPVGLVMALIGAPIFLHLILRRRFAI
ncbi:MAG: iron ABC transporter permease [Pseudomonadota bacterium]